MQNKTQEQVYSMAGIWYFDYEKMMINLRNIHNKGEEVEVFEADKIKYHHLDFIITNSLIKDMQTTAIDVCGYIAEEYLDEITDEERCDLAMHVAEWFEKNAKLDFFGVENVRKIMVVVE